CATSVTMVFCGSDDTSAPGCYCTGPQKWANYGGDWQPAQAATQPFGVVRLAGVITLSSKDLVNPIFILSADYRPAHNEVFVVSCDHATGPTYGHIDVLRTGEVVYQECGGGGWDNVTWLSLSGITFQEGDSS